MEQFIKTIIKQAGNAVKERFGKIGVKYAKTHSHDVVTEADLAANAILVNAIQKRYPSHGIISEETGEYQKDAEYVWILDPLDGTNNFARHIPLFGAMAAVARGKHVLYGAIYDPIHNELVFARTGNGAFLNNQKIHCSKTKIWGESSGFTSCWMKPKTMRVNRRLLESNAKNQWSLYRALWSIAIETIYVASGRCDWLISTSGGLWDYAAPPFILKEAGCTVTNFQGEPWQLEQKDLVASTPLLHSKTLEIIQFDRIYTQEKIDQFLRNDVLPAELKKQVAVKLDTEI
ncbi:MAG: inositol monophosphatase [Candidatus Jacksonbacteria bacterium]|nr:inositol monophosphatase [Candidatus Jacksonbacteria bacterium]